MQKGKASAILVLPCAILVPPSAIDKLHKEGKVSLQHISAGKRKKKEPCSILGMRILSWRCKRQINHTYTPSATAAREPTQYCCVCRHAQMSLRCKKRNAHQVQFA